MSLSRTEIMIENIQEMFRIASCVILLRGLEILVPSSYPYTMLSSNSKPESRHQIQPAPLGFQNQVEDKCFR
jgi:hypothetical protein